MQVSEFFKERKEEGVELVLATVIATRGSTYSKRGDQMIIDGEGEFCGMLSGGCLEGDLVERSRSVVETKSAQTVTYDLGADDELWGLGVGCDGSLDILLQPMSPETGYQPFAAIAEVLEGNEPATISLASGADAPPGQRLDLSILIRPAPYLLILGAGPDSEPLVRIATELGWRSMVVDHRPEYGNSRSYPHSTRSLCIAADKLATSIGLQSFDAAIVMSHHLASDRSYLQQLAASDIGYIGLLGPAGRKDRLMKDLGDVSDRLTGRLHGPAGIKLGGRGPGSIALEIVAGIQEHLNQ